MLGDGLGGNCSIKQSGKKRIIRGGREEREQKETLECSAGAVGVYSALTSRSRLDLVFSLFCAGCW